MTSTNNKKIMLLAANFGGNVGDLFIYEAVANFIHQQLPQAETHVYPYPLRNDQFVALPAVLQSGLNSNIKIKPPLFALRKSVDHYMRSRPFLEKLIINNYFSPLMSCIKKSSSTDIQYDHIVSVGGEMDIPYSLLDIHSYLNAMKKPLKNIIYGPISLKIKPQHIPFLKQCFADVDEIAIRDPRTFKNLKNIGIENIKLVPDCAFLAYKGEQSQSSWKGYIGLCLHSRWAHQKHFNDYIKGFSDAAKKLDSKLILFVTNIREDHLLVTKLMDLVHTSDNIEITLPTSTKELQKLYQKTDLVISDRLHGILIGMISGCNVLPIATRDKIKGYCEYLKLSNFLTGEENNQELYQKMEKAKNNHNTLKKSIAEFASSASSEVKSYYTARLNR